MNNCFGLVNIKARGVTHQTGPSPCFMLTGNFTACVQAQTGSLQGTY